jgi:hypothetical protein
VKTIDQLREEAHSIAEDMITIHSLYEETCRRFTALRADLEQYARLPERTNGDAPAQLPPGRIRSAAFTRQPRAVTNQQVRGMLADGEWHAAAELAVRNSDGTREHFHYLNASFARSLREGEHDGIYESRPWSGRIEEFGVGYTRQYRLTEVDDD